MLQTTCRVLCLHAAARRLGVPERTLRYRASRGLLLLFLLSDGDELRLLGLSLVFRDQQVALLDHATALNRVRRS